MFRSSADSFQRIKRSKILLTFLILVFTGLTFGEREAVANSVTLTWTDPTTNTDGTALLDLGGFKIYFGTTSQVYTSSIDVGHITTVPPTYTVNNLGSGTYYFAVTAYDTSGVESTYSNEFVDTFSTPPPVISGVAAGSVTSNSALITWTTDTASTSQVQYGTTTGYGSTTSLNSSLVTSHSQSISSLQASTLYHYRVLSTDSSGNLSVSGDFTFSTTAANPPQISGVSSGSVTTNSALITWTTNVAATSQIQYGASTAYGYTTSLNSSLVTSHSQTIGSLLSGTLYHFRVMSADASGNLSVSGDNTFTTSQPVVNPPNISGVSSGSITSTGAIVTWSTDVNSTSQVEYGTSTAYGTMTTLDSTLVTSHSQTIGSLTAGTLYHYRVRSADGSGNLGVSSDFTFTTLASPVISGVASGSITTTGATVTWTTNTPTTSHVEYGTTAAYGYSTQLDPALVTSHSQTLSALQPGTTYHYRVDSSDSGGSVASSADNTFVTAQAPAPPPTSGPVISNVTTGSVTNSGAVISWSSNIPSTSQLEFGSSSNYGFADQPDSSMATVHSHKLTGLQPGTLYHFRVDSTDGSGNLNLSNDFTFSTGGQPFPTHPSSPNLFRK